MPNGLYGFVAEIEMRVSRVRHCRLYGPTKIGSGAAWFVDRGVEQALHVELTLSVIMYVPCREDAGALRRCQQEVVRARS